MCMCRFVNVCMCIYVHVYMHVGVCMYVCAGVYRCGCVYACVTSHTQRNKVSGSRFITGSNRAPTPILTREQARSVRGFMALARKFNQTTRLRASQQKQMKSSPSPAGHSLDCVGLLADRGRQGRC